MSRNFWILAPNGTPLFIHGDKDAQKEILLSAFLGAIQMLAGTLQNSKMNKIELENHTYFYSVVHPIISVLEAEPKDETESRAFQIITQRLAKAFLEKYSEKKILDWAGTMNEFQDFITVFNKIDAEIQQMLTQSHSDFISKYFAEAAADKNILGVVVYDLEKDEILSHDIPKDCTVADFESFGSMLFAFLERLGKNLKAGGINEVLIRAKNYWIGGFRKEQLAVFMLFSQDYFGKVLPEFVSSAIDKK